MCFPGAGSGLQYLIRPRTPEQWTEELFHPRRLPSYWGKEKGRLKLIWEVSVIMLQVSIVKAPVVRLISAAVATGTQPAQTHALPAETPGASAHIACAGNSAETAEPSCRGHRGRAFTGTFTWWNTIYP